MEKLELIFSREKDTKNTIRYKAELGDVTHGSKDIAVGTLYKLGDEIEKLIYQAKVNWFDRCDTG